MWQVARRFLFFDNSVKNEIWNGHSFVAESLAREELFL
jgi:hypothetical protein